MRPPEGYESVFKSESSRFSAISKSNSGMRSNVSTGVGGGGGITDNKEPFQMIIDKNLRSMRKRAQDNTREELTSVLQRVENVNLAKI